MHPSAPHTTPRRVLWRLGSYLVAGMALLGALSAQAQTTFTTTYRNGSTYNIYGKEPSAAGKYPVYVHTVGTGEAYDSAWAKAAIDAAVAAGVRRVTYTSAPQADTSTLILAPEHKATEEYLAAAPITATILRNGWYTENFQSEFGAAQATGVIANSVGETARIASAPRADLAEAAAIVLTTDGHDGKVYELTGDTAWTFPEFAEALSRVLDKPVEYRTITADEERAGLAAAGLPAEVVDLVVSLNQSTREGQLSVVTDDLSRILGRPTTPIAETLRTWK